MSIGFVVIRSPSSSLDRGRPKEAALIKTMPTNQQLQDRLRTLDRMHRDLVVGEELQIGTTGQSFSLTGFADSL